MHAVSFAFLLGCVPTNEAMSGVTRFGEARHTHLVPTDHRTFPRAAVANVGTRVHAAAEVESLEWIYWKNETLRYPSEYGVFNYVLSESLNLQQVTCTVGE